MSGDTVLHGAFSEAAAFRFAFLTGFKHKRSPLLSAAASIFGKMPFLQERALHNKIPDKG